MAERRAKGRCVECNAPSLGLARCEPCSLRHRESSGAFRGIPLWDPSWTVIAIATGEELGTYDSEMEVAACLAFAKLSRDEVEVIADVSPMATFTAPRLVVSARRLGGGISLLRRRPAVRRHAYRRAAARIPNPTGRTPR